MTTEGPRRSQGLPRSPSAGSPAPTEPRMPERTRILRPSFWSDAVPGQLSDAEFRLYLGLATCADDEGWTLWRPATLAAHLYRFQSVKRRERQLELNANGLVEAGLLEFHPCGCAFLPFHYRDFRQKGGNHSNAVRDFHVEHVGPDESVQVSTGPASESVSGSVEGKEAVSGTESGSAAVSDLGANPARDALGPTQATHCCHHVGWARAAATTTNSGS